MRIKSLKINGYKNLNIDLKHETDIIAAIGNNGSGKSNLLEAFCRIFGSLYDKSSVDFSYNITFVNIDNQTICVEQKKFKKASMLVDGNSPPIMDDYLPKRIVVIYSGEEDRLWRKCIEPFFEDYIRDINKSSRGKGVIDTLPRMLYFDKHYWNIALLSILCSDAEDNKHFLKNLLKISDIERITIDFKKGRYDTYAQSKTLQFINFIDKKNEYTIEEFKNIVLTKYIADDVFRYMYVAYAPSKSNIIDNITIKFNNDLTIEDLSEGEKKLLLVKAALEFAGQEDCLFIFDEPDAHIHVTNKEEIIKMFDPYKHNRQIVFTTHSPTLTNCLDDNNLYMLDCGTIMQREKQEKLNHLIGDSWNRHEIGAFLANIKNMTLLVEGKHDKIHIETAFNELKDEYPLDFAVYSLQGEGKIRPLMVGLYETGNYTGKTYIAIYDNDDAGNKSYNNGFKDENNSNYKKLYDKEIQNQDSCFAIILPKPKGFTKECTIENMYDASKYEEAYKTAIEKTSGYFANKSIKDIHEDIICKSKNILAENAKNFSKDDFKNFCPLFDLLLKIQNRNNSSNLESKNETSTDHSAVLTQPESSTDTKAYYFIDAKGVKAKGYLEGVPIPNKESKIVVCKDSESNIECTQGCNKSIVKIRKELIKKKVLIQKDNKYIFSEDYMFNSISTASCVILGRNTNGWTTWKDKTGKTMDEIFRKKE